MNSERLARQLAAAPDSANTHEGRKHPFPSWLHSASTRKKAAGSLRVPIEVRFYKYASPEPNSGCWLWIGACDTHNYGQLRINKTCRYATHVSLELSGRPRPSPDHVARHKCDNSNCVNPDHLEWGTQKQNVADSIERGRANMSGLESGRGWNVGLKQSHCKRGHPREGFNLTAAGSCRACKNFMKRESRRLKNSPVHVERGPAPIRDAARTVVLRMIELEPDPSERKAKIMIAREDGHLSDAEARKLIIEHGLEAA